MEDVVASNPQAPPLTAEEKEILESDRIGILLNNIVYMTIVILLLFYIPERTPLS